MIPPPLSLSSTSPLPASASSRDISEFQSNFQQTLRAYGITKAQWNHLEWKYLFERVTQDVYSDMHLRRFLIKGFFGFNQNCRMLPSIYLEELKSAVKQMDEHTLCYFQILASLVEFAIPCDQKDIPSYVNRIKEIVQAKGGMIQINRFTEEKQDFYVYLKEINYPIHLIVGEC